MNKCWFAARIVAVKRKYRLTVDRREAAALERVLAGCASTAMIVTVPGGPAATPARRARRIPGRPAPLRRQPERPDYLQGKRGATGSRPVPRSHPAYPFMRDGDGDGVVCE